MTQQKSSSPTSEPPQGWRLLISTTFAAVLLTLLGWAFIFHPALTELRRTLINIFTAFLAGAVGFIWAGAALNFTRTRGKIRFVIQATNGCALFLLVYYNPPFREGSVAAGPRIYLQRICGQEVAMMVKPVMADAVCAVEGEVLGQIDPEAELCIEVIRAGEEPNRTCLPAVNGRFSVSDVAIREAGFAGSTDAEISAVLIQDDEVADAIGAPAAVPVVVAAPDVRVSSVSVNGGFTVQGTAVNLLPDEQLAVRVEDAKNMHNGVAYLYADNQGGGWTAHDRGDALIAPSDAYRLTLFVGPSGQPLKSFRTLPERFREIAAPSFVRIH